MVAMSTFRGWYSVVRYIPDLTRGEFVNVGVVLECRELKFRQLKHMSSFAVDKGPFRCHAKADGHFLNHAMDKLRRQFDEEAPETGVKDWSPAGQIDRLSQGFRNNVRLSKPGVVTFTDPDICLDRLFEKFVGRTDDEPTTVRLTRTNMRRAVKHTFRQRGIFARFGQYVRENVALELPMAPRIDLAYKNGVYHYYQVMPLAEDETSVALVNSYRMIVRDARGDSAQSKPEFQGAQFSVFGRVVSKSKRTKALRETLQADDIRILDFERGAEEVAETIERELSLLS